MADILELHKNFASIKFMYFSKDLNVTSHSLANFFFNSDMNVDLLYSFFNWLNG